MLSQLGRPEDGTDAKLFNNLEVFIKLKPMKEWRAGLHTLDDITAIMTNDLRAIPGIESDFSQPIRDNVNENISGQQGQVAVKIYGDDVVQLRKLADAAEAVIAKVPGVADPAIVKADEEPVIAVNPDRETAYRYWGDALMMGQNKQEDSRQKFTDAIVAEPYNRRAWVGLTQWSQHYKIPLGHPRIEPPTSVSPLKDNKMTITIDESVGKKEDGSAAWVVYGMSRAVWSTEKFAREFPN